MNTVSSNTHKPLLIFAALVTAGGYFYIAIPECVERAAMCFQSQSPAPYRYRILSMILERLIAPDGNLTYVLLADIMIHTACVILIYFLLWRWLRQWVDARTAATGVLLVAAAWLMSYYFYLKTITTVLEMVCVIAALLAVKSRLFLYAALVIVASLNRETGVFLVLIWIACHADQWRTRDYWIRAGVLMLIYGAVMVTLRVALGSADHVLGIAGTWAYNLRDIREAVLINIILAPVWCMLANGYRRAPALLQRLVWVGVLYLGAIVCFAAWSEMPRLILPLIPLVLPAILYPIAGHVAPSQIAESVVK